jgi:putative transposase
VPQQGALHRQKGGKSAPEQEQGDTTAGKGIGANPTDRGKMGVKQSLLVEGDGGPLSICIAAANVNDHLLLAATLDAIVVERPQPTAEQPQHLCLDKGFDNAPTRQVVEEHGYLPHIRRLGEEKKDVQGNKTHPARRWVVERSFSWLQRWRGILNRWEKKPQNYLANLKLACALLWFRRAFKAASALLR